MFNIYLTMKKYFDPLSIEANLYKFWEDKGCFKPTNKNNMENYCIVIPPPNITGNLHIGHAFQQTIMDILIRYHRMQGKNTFWQVGTDHAGIATQIIVKNKIFKEEKKTIQQFDSKYFLKKIWNWKENARNVIISQMRRLGISADWTKEKFTLDPQISYSVKEAFIILYNQNLIYKRKKLVNWDPILQTVISDVEVEHKNTIGKMWYIKYYLVDSCFNINTKKEYIIVATTRPETLFGDTAIAVNPNDDHYKKFIGRKVVVPIINRIIPIIGDNFVSQEMGTGFVKITPAHDFNDYEVAVRNNLPIINIFTKDGNISTFFEEYDINGKISQIYNEKLPMEFCGLNRFLVRKKVLNILNSLNILVKTENHNLVIPYGERSGSIIEPLLTSQWYLNVTLLAKNAINSVKKGDIIFLPKKYENVYYSWMNSIQDWCISRQLLWGHRIPIWYDTYNNIYVGHNEKAVRKKYNISDSSVLTQDNDVLDTWFSSSLWMFSSLGWPKKTDLFNNFYSTNVVVSGFDIIFFWIARMIMLSLNIVKNSKGDGIVPFKTVYITGLICDENGLKMSKSKGNVIDPIDMIDGITLQELIKKRTQDMMVSKLVDQIQIQTKNLFPNGIIAVGTDALRFTCAALSTPTRYIKWNINRLYGYRNFCNKLWNASRFVLISINTQKHITSSEKKTFSISDKWILIEFNNLVKLYRNALDNYRFDFAANILYEFIWNKFCDFYIEIVKPYIFLSSNSEFQGIKYTLIYVLESVLRLAHPIIPFITEEIWQKFKHFLKEKHYDTIMLQKFPKYDPKLVDLVVLEEMDFIKNILLTVRNFRSYIKISYKKSLSIFFQHTNFKTHTLIEKYKNYIKRVANLNDISVVSKKNSKNSFKTYVIPGAKILIPYTKSKSQKMKIDSEQYLSQALFKIQTAIKKLEKIVQNKDFINKAPKHVIKKENKNLKYYKEKESELLNKKLNIQKK